MKRVLVIVFVLLSGCASDSQRPSDRQLVEHLRALMRDAPPLARESVNNNRPHGQYGILQRILLREQPPGPMGIKEARKRLWFQIALLEQSRRWPAPPELRVPRLRDAAIEIDGQLNDRAWQGALSVPIVFAFNQIEATRPEPASAKLVWDERFLYVAFAVEKDPICAERVPRDGPTYANDCVEVFLMPDLRSNVYWEFNVTAYNDVFDSLSHKFFDRDGFYARREETADGLRTATVIRVGGYDVELAIPWDQMPLWTAPPQAGARLLGLLALADRPRLGPDAPVTYYSHTPMLASFHNIWGFSTIVLSE